SPDTTGSLIDGGTETTPVRGKECTPGSVTAPLAADVRVEHLEVLSDLSDTIWTYSPIAIRLGVSSVGTPSEPFDLELMIGLVPRPAANEPVADSTILPLCAMQIVRIEDFDGNYTVKEFRHLIIPDECLD